MGPELLPGLDRALVRPITIDEYERMCQAGVIGEDERVELLEGVIVLVNAQGTAHARAVQRLNRLLIRALPDEWVVRPQLPLHLGRYSMPEPDLAVVAAEEAERPQGHPSMPALLIEVSDSSLGKDRVAKAHLYARFGIPEYWIVNLRDRCIEVLREPDPEARRYRDVSTHGDGATLEPAHLVGVRISVTEIIPR